jgi:hypothetical protein
MVRAFSPQRTQGTRRIGDCSEQKVPGSLTRRPIKEGSEEEMGICSGEKTNRYKSAAIKVEAIQWGGKLVRCETGMPMRGRPVVNIL